MTSHRATWARTTAIVILAIALLGLYTWAFHDAFAVREPGAVDFYVRYQGTRLYLSEGINPYSEQVTDLVHSGIFGSRADTLGPQHAFFYPLYTMFLIAPYTLLPTYAWVQAAWQVTLQVLLVASVILTLRYFGWRPAPWLLALVVLWSILLYPSARAILLGQISVVVFFLTILTFWLLFRCEPSAWRDVAAGICLALSTVKPQMQFLIIPLLVLWALRARRWHFLASAALSMGLLLGVSFAMVPTWLTDWLAQVTSYYSYMPVQPPILYFVTHNLTQLGDVVMWILRLLLAGWLLVEWWLLLRDRSLRTLDWVLCLTLVATHFLAPQTGTYQYVVFIFVLLPALRRLITLNGWAAATVMLAMLIGEWWLFVSTVTGNVESHIMSVPLPFITLAMLLLARNSLLKRPPARVPDNQGRVAA